MRSSDFIFDCVHILYFRCYKINFKQGGSYVGSPDWVKTKKQQYTVTVALNHEEIGKDSERITKLILL